MSSKRRTKIYTNVTTTAGKTRADVRIVDQDTGEVISSYGSMGKDAESATAAALSGLYKEAESASPETAAEIRSAQSSNPSIQPGKQEPGSQKDKAKDAAKDKINPPRQTLGAPKKKKKKPPETFAPPPKEPPVPDIIKGDPEQRNHLPWPEPLADGRSGRLDPPWDSELKEPVPDFAQRPGERVITGANNNNASIVLGRDRTGFGEKYTVNFKHTQSGYSDHMGAGAIDLVVGRGAPFPMNELGPGNPLIVHPMFQTVTSEEVPELKAATLIDGVPHPGFMMDAARIYMSQMTDVDHNFNIKPRRVGSTLPSSAIALKADKVRLFARKDIKIVTSGSEEPFDSMGYERNKIAWGIHLVAGNGEIGAQQPIPLGENLTTAMSELVNLFDKFIGVFDGVVKAQMEYNGVLMTHFHQSPLFGAPTSPSLTAVPFGTKVLVDHFARAVAGSMFMKINLARYKGKYLTRGGDSYINSSFNTSN